MAQWTVRSTSNVHVYTFDYLIFARIYTIHHRIFGISINPMNILTVNLMPYRVYPFIHPSIHLLEMIDISFQLTKPKCFDLSSFLSLWMRESVCVHCLEYFQCIFFLLFRIEVIARRNEMRSSTMPTSFAYKARNWFLSILLNVLLIDWTSCTLSVYYNEYISWNLIRSYYISLINIEESWKNNDRSEKISKISYLST